MAILDRFTGKQSTDQAANESDVDYWAVRRMPFDNTGGFRSVEGWDNLEDPIDRETFEWNIADPEPGVYRLFAVRDSRYIRAPDEHRWKWRVEDESEPDQESPEATADLSDEIQKLREEVRKLADDREPEQLEPEMVETQLRVKIMEEALQNPRFMELHGERIAIAAFEGLFGRSNRLEYDEFAANPKGAALYSFTQTLMEDPQKFKEVGENLGAGVEGFLDGMDQTTGVAGESEPEGSATDEFIGGFHRRAAQDMELGLSGMDFHSSPVKSTIDRYTDDLSMNGSPANDSESSNGESSDDSSAVDSGGVKITLGDEDSGDNAIADSVGDESVK